MNVIEQVNQTFTILVTLQGARWIFERHPDVGPLELRLGTHAGFDIRSAEPCMIVAAEAFAATRPDSNRKLEKDIARLVDKAAEFQYRYVFLHCPDVPLGRCRDLENPAAAVEVWSVAV